jgi:hypothetical protein
VVRKDWANAVQEEIVGVILAAGLSLDKTLQNQLLTAINALVADTAEVAGMISDAADTGSVTTDHLRVVVGAQTSQASGSASAVLASISGIASGGRSMVAASSNGTAGGSQSAILACGFASARVNAGTSSVLIACDDSGGLAAPTTTGGDAAAAIASDGGTVSALLSGDHVAMIASGGASGAGTMTLSGFYSAILACNAADTLLVNGTNVVAIASKGGTVNGFRNVLLAATDGDFAAGANDCLLAATLGTSSMGTSAQAAAIIAADGCDLGDTASAFNAAIIASADASLNGAKSAIVACDGDTADGDDVSCLGTKCAIIASSGGATTAGTDIAADVAESAIVASRDVVVDATSGTLSRALVAASEDVNVTGASNSDVAAIASKGCDIDNSQAAVVASSLDGANRPSATAGQTLVAASFGAAEAGGDRSAVIASWGACVASGGRSAILACGDTGAQDVDVSADNGAAVSVKGSVNVNTENFVVVGSAFNATDFGVATHTTNPGIGGGTANGLTWWIDSVNGRIALSDTSTDTTGGAPTLENLPSGGTDVIKWFKFEDGSGTAYWIPGWLA